MQQALSEAAAALEQGDNREATGDARTGALEAQVAALQERSAQLERALRGEQPRPDQAGGDDAERAQQLQLTLAGKDAALAEKTAQVTQLQVPAAHARMHMSCSSCGYSSTLISAVADKRGCWQLASLCQTGHTYKAPS